MNEIVEITGKDSGNFFSAHFEKTLETEHGGKFSSFYYNGIVSKQCKCPVEIEIGKRYIVKRYTVSMYVIIHELEPYETEISS
jgi:hypothetical protein